MEYGIYLTGAFGQSQDLYRVRNVFKRGRGSSEQLEKQIVKDSIKVVEEQECHYCTFIIDPQFRYFDILQPFIEQLDQVFAGPQENWFNNNTFYRRPQIKGPLKQLSKSFTLPYLNKSLLREANSSMVLLPSPYTLYALSDCSGYEDPQEAIISLALTLRHEIEFLKMAGIKRIQFDEPVIAMKNALGSLKKEDMDLLKIAFDVMAPFEGVSTSLSTYFARVGNLLENFILLPVDCIGVDCTETSIDAIASVSFEGKELALGIVNARSPAMEDVNEILKKVKKVAELSKPKKLYLVPNTGFEFIGWTYGHMKLDILKNVLMKAEKNANIISPL